jgi:uncharacterized protein YdeI (YjbR/CyaY-like superfamily)
MKRDGKSFASAAAWETWLAANHARSTEFWLTLRKVGAKVSGVTYAEALELALCYGWIDAQKGALDEELWLQRFTPRASRSKWSKVNRDKATALMAAGRMQPAGLREVERAKADGRWAAAYDSPRTATVPADLAAALEASPKARAFFETLDGANRYAVLYRIQSVKRAETRARKIETLVAMMAAGRKLHG